MAYHYYFDRRWANRMARAVTRVTGQPTTMMAIGDEMGPDSTSFRVSDNELGAEAMEVISSWLNSREPASQFTRANVEAEVARRREVAQ